MPITDVFAGDSTGTRADWPLLLRELAVAVAVTEGEAWTGWRDVNEAGSTGSED